MTDFATEYKESVLAIFDLMYMEFRWYTFMSKDRKKLASPMGHLRRMRTILIDILTYLEIEQPQNVNLVLLKAAECQKICDGLSKFTELCSFVSEDIKSRVLEIERGFVDVVQVQRQILEELALLPTEKRSTAKSRIIRISYCQREFKILSDILDKRTEGFRYLDPEESTLRYFLGQFLMAMPETFYKDSYNYMVALKNLMKVLAKEFTAPGDRTVAARHYYPVEKLKKQLIKQWDTTGEGLVLSRSQLEQNAKLYQLFLYDETALGKVVQETTNRKKKATHVSFAIPCAGNSCL